MCGLCATRYGQGAEVENAFETRPKRKDFPAFGLTIWRKGLIIHT